MAYNSERFCFKHNRFASVKDLFFFQIRFLPSNVSIHLVSSQSAFFFGIFFNSQSLLFSLGPQFLYGPRCARSVLSTAPGPILERLTADGKQQRKLLILSSFLPSCNKEQKNGITSLTIHSLPFIISLYCTHSWRETAKVSFLLFVVCRKRHAQPLYSSSTGLALNYRYTQFQRFGDVLVLYILGAF